MGTANNQLPNNTPVAKLHFGIHFNFQKNETSRKQLI
jgi:hypothetical protein